MLKHLRGSALFLIAIAAFGQEATKVEPKHYRLAFENEYVRVVDIHYGPHEHSAMHQHPAGVLIYVTDGHFRFTDENGKALEAHAKGGESRWFQPFSHKVENLSDRPFDGVYVEIKSKPHE